MQPTTMLPKLTESTQTISFSEGDGVCSAEVYASDVLVTTNAGNHNHGSSKVKLKNLVDYNWEPKFYSGQLLAVHMSGKYLAYSIKAPNATNPGNWTGMVRVVYTPELGSDKRALIKDMKGEVQDLAFAHMQNQVVLASIDELGNFYVHEIEATDSGLRCTKVAEEQPEPGVAPGAPHRVVWCPYIPDDDDAPEDDVARLLLTTHANIARMWNIGSVGLGSEEGGGARACGGAWGAEHGAPLVDAAFSPDGTALATAAADGHVMFYQVYMDNESSPRCLHKWQPHGGKPLSCLFFLDNHKNYNTDVQFWKFAVTGAENNTVIKIWSCKSWNCLQTVRFMSPLEGPGLKAALDRSAGYLLLADLRARSLYVLGMSRDRDDSAAYCSTISEFLLPYPVLSFCILDAEEELAKCESSCDDPFHRNGSGGDAPDSPDEFDVNNEEGSGSCGGGPERMVRLRLYIVQPKGLQEGELIYPAPRTEDFSMRLSELSLEEKATETVPIASSILQQQSQQLKNLLMRSQTQPGSLIVQRAESPPLPTPLNLMTPDAFSSPGKREEEDPPLSATPDVAGVARVSTGVVAVNEIAAGVTSSEAGRGPYDPNKLTSGGSSPSREVQQIMAHERPYYKENEAEEDTEEPSELPAANVSSSSAVEPVNGEVFTSSPLYEKPLPQSAKLTHNSSDSSWPQISLAQISEANQRKASSDKSSSHSLNTLLLPTESRLSPAEKARLDAIEYKLDKLIELVSGQAREVRSLRGEVCGGRALVDAALNAHHDRTAAAVSDALTAGWERISRMGEAASARAAQAAGAGAARALEPLAAALQHELAAKITATDHLLRENIDKLASSKIIMERLSTTIAKSLSEMVRESFRTTMVDNVVPLMEKAHAQIFRQINTAFQNGTKEFAAQTEAAARAAAERGGAAAAAGLRAALDRHAAALAAAPPPAPPQHYAAALQDAAHSVLEKEMTWWREQVSRQMSRAHSPATTQSAHHDRQMQVAQIQSLIGAGDVNGAFQLALSASDLALVVAACRAAEPGAVFGPPCRLKQHVLLSLVQQLAADMPRDTHLKHRYLEEAVMNLDTTNPVTREHLPVVVHELQKQVLSFLGSAPNHALARQFKMLLMAADSLVKAA